MNMHHSSISCLLAAYYDALMYVRALLAYQRALCLYVYTYTVLHPEHVNALCAMPIDRVYIMHCAITTRIALLHDALRYCIVHSGVLMLIYIYFNALT